MSLSPEFWAKIEELRAKRAAEWDDPRHPGCCWRCGWHVSSHGVYMLAHGLDCPIGVSSAAAAGHLPRSGPLLVQRTATGDIETWDGVQWTPLVESPDTDYRGDALDMAVNAGGVVSMRRYGDQIKFATVAPPTGVIVLTPDEALAVAGSLFAAAKAGRFAERSGVGEPQQPD